MRFHLAIAATLILASAASASAGPGARSAGGGTVIRFPVERTRRPSGAARANPSSWSSARPVRSPTHEMLVAHRHASAAELLARRSDEWSGPGSGTALTISEVWQDVRAESYGELHGDEHATFAALMRKVATRDLAVLARRPAAPLRGDAEWAIVTAFGHHRTPATSSVRRAARRAIDGLEATLARGDRTVVDRAVILREVGDVARIAELAPARLDRIRALLAAP